MIDDYDESSGWMFLLVPAHPGFPGQIPQSRKTVVCVCVCVVVTRFKPPLQDISAEYESMLNFDLRQNFQTEFTAQTRVWDLSSVSKLY